MSYKCLRGKTFVVTGAASGMGREISILLAQQGANIGLVDLHKPDHVLADIEKTGGQALAVAADVTDSLAVNTAHKAVVDRFGRLDGAANMAGIIGKFKMGDESLGIRSLKDDEWDSVMGTNLNGVKNCLRAQFNLIEGSGSIVNAASVAGQMPTPFNSPYGASKFGVVSLTKTAAQEVGPKGIRVNAVAPGFVWTGLAQSFTEKETLHNNVIKHRVALRRMAEPEDIARVVLFLLSDESRYITGSVVNVDGGYS